MSDDLFSPVITDADPDAFDAIRASIPRARRIRHFLALDLAQHVTEILRQRGKKRRWLAQRLGKTDSELSKWLSGTHNITLDSIAKLSDALEVDLFVSTRFPMGYFGSVRASTVTKTTVTHSDFDQSNYSLAQHSKKAVGQPRQPTRQQLSKPLKQQAVCAVLNPGDYDYAMAA